MNELVPSGVIREAAPKSVEGEPVWAPLCIWCGAEWDDANISLYSYGGGCDTCGYGSGASVSITCHACGKLMYEKETY